MNQLFSIKFPGNVRKQGYCEINGTTYHVLSQIKSIEDGEYFTTLILKGLEKLDENCKLRHSQQSEKMRCFIEQTIS